MWTIVAGAVVAGALLPVSAGGNGGGGTRVLFVAGKKIWAIPAGGGAAKPIHREQEGIESLAAPPSGRLIVFGSEERAYRMRGDGSRVRAVRTFPGREVDSIDVSRDGKWILATLARGTKEAIVMFRADGTGDAETLVGGLRFPDGEAEFSPDRRSIIYGKGTDVFSKRVRGGAPSLLRRDAEDPTFSPGGKIAFGVPDEGLWIMNANGSGARRIFKRQEIGVDNPTFAPTGAALAFDALPERGSYIGTVRIDGTSHRHLSERGSNPEWTRNP